MGRSAEFAVLGFAASVVLSTAAATGPCAKQTLDNYVKAGFTCTIDDKTFSNFAYIQQGGSGIADNAVTVTPTDPANGPSIDFSGAWKGSSLINSITYTVATTSGKKIHRGRAA
jgi:hypothetical protein